jgi:hypothetical protein
MTYGKGKIDDEVAVTYVGNDRPLKMLVVPLYDARPGLLTKFVAPNLNEVACESVLAVTMVAGVPRGAKPKVPFSNAAEAVEAVSPVARTINAVARFIRVSLFGPFGRCVSNEKWQSAETNCL